MRFLRLVLFFFAITISHSLNGKVRTTERLSGTKLSGFSGQIESIRKDFEQTIKGLPGLPSDAEDKIKTIESELGNKVAELADKRTNKDLNWFEYAKEKFETIEKYDKKIDEFLADEKYKNTPYALKRQFAKQVNRVVGAFLLDKKEEANNEFDELETLVDTAKQAAMTSKSPGQATNNILSTTSTTKI